MIVGSVAFDGAVSVSRIVLVVISSRDLVRNRSTESSRARVVSSEVGRSSGSSTGEASRAVVSSSRGVSSADVVRVVGVGAGVGRVGGGVSTGVGAGGGVRVRREDFFDFVHSDVKNQYFVRTRTLSLRPPTESWRVTHVVAERCVEEERVLWRQARESRRFQFIRFPFVPRNKNVSPRHRSERKRRHSKQARFPPCQSKRDLPRHSLDPATRQGPSVERR